MERSLRRHRQEALPAVDNWHEIPEVYRVTRRGRTDDFGEAEYRGEAWLRPIPEEHEMLLAIPDRCDSNYTVLGDGRNISQVSKRVRWH